MIQLHQKTKWWFSEIMGSYGFSSDLRDRRFMPTSGSIIGFNQSLPIYADKASIKIDCQQISINRLLKI